MPKPDSPLWGRPDPQSASGARQRPRRQGPTHIGRYRLVSEIGRGGMASVHLARMDGPGGFHKWVAIKQIHEHLVDNDQFVDMFLDEARMAAGISHPNVAQVFDIGKDESVYWIAMEYLQGEPLREIMRHQTDLGRPLPFLLAARIIADAAEGLHAAHEIKGQNGQPLGLVHRDVTPHNLFVTYDGYTKVVDFGVAKAAGRLAWTNAGQIKGKLAYMSPEQVRDTSGVDRTSDIYALGIVLWELTTNERLFKCDTDLGTLEKVQACVVPPPSSIVPTYPRELEKIVLKALARDKRDRYQTARQLARDLSTFIAHSGAYVGPEDIAVAMQDAFGDKLRRREQHLAWALEVTSAFDLPEERIHSQTSLPTESMLADVQLPTKRKATPSSVVPPQVLSSLIDEDEDAPTMITDRPKSSSVPPPPISMPRATSLAERVPARGPAAGSLPVPRPGPPRPAAGRPSTPRPGSSPSAVEVWRPQASTPSGAFTPAGGIGRGPVPTPSPIAAITVPGIVATKNPFLDAPAPRPVDHARGDFGTERITPLPPSGPVTTTSGGLPVLRAASDEEEDERTLCMTDRRRATTLPNLVAIADPSTEEAFGAPLRPRLQMPLVAAALFCLAAMLMFAVLSAVR